MAKNKHATLARLQAKIEAEREKYKAAVLSVIESALTGSGLTLSDLVDAKPIAKGGSKRKAPFKGKQPAKYRDPKTGATWSGMGRAPGWIANARSRDRFLIETHK